MGEGSGGRRHKGQNYVQELARLVTKYVQSRSILLGILHLLWDWAGEQTVTARSNRCAQNGRVGMGSTLLPQRLIGEAPLRAYLVYINGCELHSAK